MNGTLFKVVANITPSRTTLSEPYYDNSSHWDLPELREERRPAFLKSFITHYLTAPFLQVQTLTQENLLIEFEGDLLTF